MTGKQTRKRKKRRRRRRRRAMISLLPMVIVGSIEVVALASKVLTELKALYACTTLVVPLCFSHSLKTILLLLLAIFPLHNVESPFWFLCCLSYSCSADLLFKRLFAPCANAYEEATKSATRPVALRHLCLWRPICAFCCYCKPPISRESQMRCFPNYSVPSLPSSLGVDWPY